MGNTPVINGCVTSDSISHGTASPNEKTKSENGKDINININDNNKTRRKSLDKQLYLKVDKDFEKWFPKGNAHVNITKLFELKYRINTGSSDVGTVIYEGVYKDKPCCIKVLPISGQNRLLFASEVVGLLKSRDCKGTLNLLNYYFDKEYYYIITELCDFSLHDAISHNRQLSKKRSKLIVYKLLETVSYLHHHNIGHRDIKPENILFKKNNLSQPILADFGDCELIRDDKIYTEFCGTSSYLSVERITHNYTGLDIKSSDVWSVGCIYFELLVGERLFDGKTNDEIIHKVMNNKYNYKFNQLDVDIKSFILQLINPICEERLDAKNALLHNHLLYAKNKIEKSKRNKLKNNLSETIVLSQEKP